MMNTKVIQDAKARFSELLDACTIDGSQLVTRRGVETAVLVPIAERCLIALLVLAGSSNAFAAPIITSPNVALETQYRLVFVTSGTRDARSSNIADYNSFVQAQANLSLELAALSTTWTAIGSTLTVNARDNTFSNPNTAAGVAFYQLDGLLVANNNADLWDGSLFAPVSKDQFGGFHGGTSSVWTGTHHTGVASVNPLGGSVQFPFAQFGVPGLGSGWVNTGSSHINDGVTDFNSMYAVSGVLTKGGGVTAVPEPSSLLMFAIGAMGAVGVSRRSRRSQVATIGVRLH